MENMAVQHVSVEAYANEILEHLTDVTIKDHGDTLVTFATHSTRGPLTIVQCFPGDNVLIFGRPAVAIAAAA
ncbi:MAG: hypothetical protein Q8M31_22325 [Beijerinckiaceae bacterium]|nr:hypothetical protein [Beijerinckiaceae bacterium]